MSEGFGSVVDAAMALPSEERRALARKLLQSVEPEDEAALDAAWVAEAERRLAAFDRGEMKAVPAEEVFGARKA